MKSVIFEVCRPLCNLQAERRLEVMRRESIQNERAVFEMKQEVMRHCFLVLHAADYRASAATVLFKI
jgi:hypothetical protein